MEPSQYEPDPLVDRTSVLNQVRAVAANRGPVGRTLLLTGPSGVGKTSVLRQAFADFDGDIMWFSGNKGSGTAPWAAVRNASAAVRSVAGFEGTGSREVVEQAIDGDGGAAELGRSLAERYRAMLPRPRAVVVVADDIHRCDPHSLALLLFLAHLNHTFDISYVLTCLDTRLPPGALDLEQIALHGLSGEAALEAVRRWTAKPVAIQVVDSLVAVSDGNPRLLQTLAAQLDDEQLSGRRALPLPPAVPRTSVAFHDSSLEGLDIDELSVVACFAFTPQVPIDVLHQVGVPVAIDALFERGLLDRTHGSYRVHRAALGWIANTHLPRIRHQELCAGLSAAWASVDPVQAALHACHGDAQATKHLDAARQALTQVDARADERLAEALARAVVDAARPPTARDWLTVATTAERAGHLLDAQHAFEQATLAPEVDAATFPTLARWRGFLSQVSDDPGLAVPSTRLLNSLDLLKPAALFEVATRTAWNALLVGARAQARTYLDQARQASRAARTSDRALWRLVDVSWQRSNGTAKSETLREAALRWRDSTDKRGWYDDVLLVRTLLEAGAHDEARQQLAESTSTHRHAGRYASYFFTALRLQVDLTTSNIPAALAAAHELNDSLLPGPLHVAGLTPALLRLEAVTGLPPETLNQQRRHSSQDIDEIDQVHAERDLIEGRYRHAATGFHTLLRRHPPLPLEQRWTLLADLVEAHVASDDLETAASIYAAEKPEQLAGSPAVIARAAALAAPPVETRHAFLRALAAADGQHDVTEHARTQLAFARRLSTAGATDEADQLRRRAALLFEHHRMHGWQHNADNMTVRVSTTTGHPNPIVNLDDQETAIVKLLLQGQRNQEVADRLFISLRTLEKTLTKIYAKLGVPSKARMITLLRGGRSGDPPPQKADNQTPA